MTSFFSPKVDQKPIHCVHKSLSKNLKFSVKKFEVSPQVTFSRSLLTCHPQGDVLIQPDRRQVEKLLAMTVPTCKEDVLSLLGFMAMLILWLPNLSEATETLVKKNVHFSWTKDHDACFNLLKAMVNQCLVLFPFLPSRSSFIFTDASRAGIGVVLMRFSKDQWNFI